MLEWDSPILILGETGAGKGVLARWIHANSPRADEPFVNVNCAGLSRELLESELFGYERGAFTGAVNAKQGLLEVGHRGIVFLDEIGDMDLAIQPKLLKAIEEKSFRRLGAVRDRQVDIRLIASTNLDLEELVRAKTVSRRPLLPRQHAHAAHSAAAGAPRGHPDPRAHDPCRHLPAHGQAGGPARRRGDRSVAAYAWPGNIRELTMSSSAR